MIGDSQVRGADDELKDGEPTVLVDADGDCGIQPTVPLPEPRHTTTHSHHRSHGLAPQRSVPLLVADYCYKRDVIDEELAAVFVARLYPAKAIAASVCESKGVDEHDFR